MNRKFLSKLNLEQFNNFALNKKIKDVLSLDNWEYDHYGLWDGDAIKIVFEDESVIVISSGSSSSVGILEYAKPN